METSHKREFFLLSSANVVVFARCQDSQYLISRFTDNASHLFDVGKAELAGSPLTEFMPDNIARVHDRLYDEFR